MVNCCAYSVGLLAVTKFRSNNFLNALVTISNLDSFFIGFDWTKYCKIANPIKALQLPVSNE